MLATHVCWAPWHLMLEELSIVRAGWGGRMAQQWPPSCNSYCESSVKYTTPKFTSLNSTTKQHQQNALLCSCVCFSRTKSRDRSLPYAQRVHTRLTTRDRSYQPVGAQSRCPPRAAVLPCGLRFWTHWKAPVEIWWSPVLVGSRGRQSKSQKVVANG